MCLIIVAPRGSDKNSEDLFEYIRYSSKINRDGLGLAFKRHNSQKVYINKGHTDVNNVINIIKKFKLKKDDELVVHARIGNKGEVSNENCHPFIIHNNDEFKDTLEGYFEKPVLFHNGTFSEYSFISSKESDTYLFSRNFLSNKHIMNILNDSVENFEEMFKKKIDDSRLCIINPVKGEGIVKVGKFIKENDYWFSKDNYKPYSTSNFYARNEWENDSWDYSTSKVANRTPTSYQITAQNNKAIIKSIEQKFGKKPNEFNWDIEKQCYSEFLAGLIYPNNEEDINMASVNFFRPIVTPLNWHMIDFSPLDNSKDTYVMISYGEALFNGKDGHILAIKGEEDNELLWEFKTDDELFYTYSWNYSNTYKFIFSDYIKLISKVYPTPYYIKKLSDAYNACKGPYVNSLKEEVHESIHSQAVLMAIYTLCEEKYADEPFVQKFQELIK